jgi:uncharacterized membrane protein (DUF106 family)
MLTIKDMKKTHLLILLALIVIGLLIWLIPSMVFGMKVRKLQNQLENLKTERSRCEQVQLTNHDKAIEVRSQLNTLLGTDFTEDSSKSTPQPKTT